MIKFEQVWDDYIANKYIELDGDTPVYAYTITIFNDKPKGYMKLDTCI